MDDRQSGTIWGIVINNPNEDDRIACKTLPGFVKQFLYQDEIAPTTGMLHVNGALKTKYTTQFKQIKKWLPRAHITPMTSKAHAENTAKYAHKDETAVEGTRVTLGQETFTAQGVCMMLAKKAMPHWANTEYMIEIAYDYKRLYKVCINEVLAERPELAGQLMNPSLRNFFCDTIHTWITHVKNEAEKTASEITPGEINHA